MSVRYLMNQPTAESKIKIFVLCKSCSSFKIEEWEREEYVRYILEKKQIPCYSCEYCEKFLKEYQRLPCG